MKKSRVAVSLVGLAVVVYATFAAKELRPFYESQGLGTGQCRAIKGVYGPEDVIPDHEAGVLYLSSLLPKTAPVMVAETQTPTTAGGIWIFRPGSRPRRMPIEGGPEIHGHGIGLWAGPDGTRRIFAVNHGDAGESVEILRVEGQKLVHERSVTSPAFINLNDVAPVAPDRFYVTNDHGTARGMGQRIEDFTFQRRANLVYFDGTSAKEVKSGLGFANGVIFDGERLYLAESTAHRLSVLRIAPDGSVETQAELSAHGFDNLTVLGKGHLLAAAHPSAFLFLRHAGDREQPAPSQVFEVTFDGDKIIEAERILEDDGRIFSAASAAARLGGHLYLGSVFGDAILECTEAQAGGRAP